MNLLQVRMLGSGPNGNYRPGELVTVDEVRAALLVEQGHATYDLIECAMVEAPENAMMPRARPRKRGGKDERRSEMGTGDKDSPDGGAADIERGEETPQG